MAYLYPCKGCWNGDHTKHTGEVIGAPVGPDGESGLGGAICDCQGECEFNDGTTPMSRMLDAIRNFGAE